MVWLILGEAAETVLGNLGNVRSMIIIAMCSIVLASPCFITD